MPGWTLHPGRRAKDRFAGVYRRDGQVTRRSVRLSKPSSPEFDLDSDLDSDSEGEGGDEEGLFGEGGFLGSDYDSDDNSTAAQVHRFFAKVEGLGIDLGEDMFSDPWA